MLVIPELGKRRDRGFLGLASQPAYPKWPTLDSARDAVAQDKDKIKEKEVDGI